MNREWTASNAPSGSQAASIPPMSTDPTATQPIDIESLIIEQK